MHVSNKNKPIIETRKLIKNQVSEHFNRLPLSLGGKNVPSLGTASLSMSIMEPMELKKFLLIPIMGENKFWKPWKGSWKRERMLLPWRAYGDRKLGK